MSPLEQVARCDRCNTVSDGTQEGKDYCKATDPYGHVVILCIPCADEWCTRFKLWLMGEEPDEDLGDPPYPSDAMDEFYNEPETYLSGNTAPPPTDES